MKEASSRDRVLCLMHSLLLYLFGNLPCSAVKVVLCPPSCYVCVVMYGDNPMTYGGPSTSLSIGANGRVGMEMLPAFCLIPPAARTWSSRSRSVAWFPNVNRRGLAGTAGRGIKTSSLLSTSVTSMMRVRRPRRGVSSLRCELTRLSGNAGHKVLPALATSDQWAHYWGGSDMQRVGKFFEVSAIAFLGLWACYFTSFFLGVGTTSIIGAAFLFYWLLAPNITSYRRNRALRGRIAPFPGAEGNSVAIFSARVASATEEYHPVTGRPVFLRMVIEDGEGRALKFRTRTRPDYARVRPGMVAEAVLVSPDEAFEEIVGVSDTFIPDAKVWVGEYPYLDKVAMLRLLANRDSRRGRENGMRNFEDEDETEEEYGELDTNTYYDVLRSKQEQDVRARARLVPAPRLDSDYYEAVPQTDGGNAAEYYTDYGSDSDQVAYYEDDEDEPQYEGWGSAGFSSSSNAQTGKSIFSSENVRREGDGGSANAGEGLRRRTQWERVSSRPKPRPRPTVRRVERDRLSRAPPPSAGSMRKEGAYGSDARSRWRESRARRSDVSSQNGRRR